MESGRVRAWARVTGRVQGVFYRASTRDRARQLGLVGWVKNTADGAVELEAEGEAAQVEALLRWCQSGPPGARVDDLERAELPPGGDETEFRVVR